MSYSSNLKTWASSGSEYPNTYSYQADEQPVAEYDNFVMHNLIEDTQHLLNELNGNFVLKNGQAIEDENGDPRFQIRSFNTRLNDDESKIALQARSSNYLRLYARSSQPFEIHDQEQGNTAIQYDTDASAGLLRTPKAGIRVEDNGFNATSGVGLEMRYIPNNNQSYIRSYDADVGTYRDLVLESGTLELISRGGLIDMSDSGTNPSDLRLATGQAIEDESGTERVEILSNGTFVNNDDGELALELKEGTAHRISAQSNEPVEIFDRENTHIGVKVSTGNPGTLELTNAVQTYREQSEPTAPTDGYTVWADTDGTLKTKDSAGNITTIVS